MSDQIRAYIEDYQIKKQHVVIEIPIDVARKMLDGPKALNYAAVDLANAIELAIVEYEDTERKNENDIPF